MSEFRQYAISLVLLTGLLSGYVMFRFADGYPLPVGPAFEPGVRSKYRQQVEAEQPRVLVLGDSVADTNVDPALMTERLRTPVSVISEHGAGSALLYLVLKNNILPAEARPEYLVVLFRDTVLTAPAFRVQGNFLRILDEYAGTEDDFVLDIAVRDRMNPLDKAAEAYFPPYGARQELQALLSSRVLFLPTRALFGCDSDCSDRAMDNVFGSQNFDPDQFDRAINLAESYLYFAESLDFESQVGRSFLPGIIRLSKENGIQLVLVRTKTLRFSRENPEPGAVQEYMNVLAAYARENDIPLIDFSRSDRLDPGLYADVNHLNREGERIFTEMLVDALRPIVHR